MSRSLTASDRSALIKLASSLPKGSPERRTILAGLVKTSFSSGKMVRLLEPTVLRYYNGALGPAFRPEHKKYNLKANTGDVLYVVEAFTAQGEKGLLVVPEYKLTKAGLPKGGDFARYFIPANVRIEGVDAGTL